MSSIIEMYCCKCCGNEWEDYDNTEYIKCEMCGAKEKRDEALKSIKVKNNDKKLL